MGNEQGESHSMEECPWANGFRAPEVVAEMHEDLCAPLPAVPTRMDKVSSELEGINDGSGLRLVSIGDAWNGECGEIARTMLRLVIKNHYPRANDMSATVILWTDEGARFDRYIGKVNQVTDDELVFSDGVRVPFDRVISVEV